MFGLFTVWAEPGQARLALSKLGPPGCLFFFRAMGFWAFNELGWAEPTGLLHMWTVEASKRSQVGLLGSAPLSLSLRSAR